MKKFLLALTILGSFLLSHAQNDSSAAFTLSKESITIFEKLIPGSKPNTSTVVVTLNSQPNSDVNISLDYLDKTEFTVSPTTATFTSSNWNTPQIFTFTAIDDAIDDDDVTVNVDFISTTTSHDSGSGDGSHDSGSGDGSHDSGSGDGSHDSGSGDGSHDSGSGDGSHDSGSGDGSHDSGSGDGSHDSGSGDGSHDSGSGDGSHDSGSGDGSSDVETYTSTLAVTVKDDDTTQINFSEDWISAAILGDQGAVPTIIDDPSNSGKGKVLNVVYGGEGSQDWQNAQILIPVGQKKIDLRTTKTVSFDIWTSHDDTDANKGKYSGLLKLESPTTGASNASIEKGFVTSGNGWETITVDFTDNYKGDNGGTSDDQFRKIVLFTNYGGGTDAHQVSGGVHKKEDTRVYDNFVYAEGDEVPAPPTPITELTVDFETPSGFKAYSNIVYADMSADGAGYNSNGYGYVSKVNEDWWAQIGLDASGPLDLSSKDRGISIMVKGDRQSKLTLKIQDGDDFNNSHEIRPDDFNYTAVGEWQKVTWDLSAYDSNDKGENCILL